MGGSIGTIGGTLRSMVFEKREKCAAQSVKISQVEEESIGFRILGGHWQTSGTHKEAVRRHWLATIYANRLCLCFYSLSFSQAGS